MENSHNHIKNYDSVYDGHLIPFLKTEEIVHDDIYIEIYRRLHSSTYLDLQKMLDLIVPYYLKECLAFPDKKVYDIKLTDFGKKTVKEHGLERRVGGLM